MSDLKRELASLRIDRDRPARSARRWPLLLLVPACSLLGALYALRAGGRGAGSRSRPSRPTLQPGGTRPPAGRPSSPPPGYVVARRKAVVSAKIQGRLADAPGRGGQPRPRGRADRAAREQRLRGAGARAPAPRTSARRPTWPRTSGCCAQAQPPRRRADRRPDHVEVAESRVRMAAGGHGAGAGRDRLRAGPAREHAHPGPVHGHGGQEDGRGGGERGAHPARREPLHVVGRDRGPRRPRHAGGRGRRQRVQRGASSAPTSRPRSRWRRSPTAATAPCCGRSSPPPTAPRPRCR